MFFLFIYLYINTYNKLIFLYTKAHLTYKQSANTKIFIVTRGYIRTGAHKILYLCCGINKTKFKLNSKPSRCLRTEYTTTMLLPS